MSEKSEPIASTADRFSIGRSLKTILILGAIGGFVVWQFKEVQKRAIELDRRPNCAATLRAIGQSIHRYAAANPDHAFPADLSAALAADIYFEGTPACPFNKTSRATYFYFPGHGKSSPENQPIVYEDPSTHLGDGGNVLFANGHARFIKTEELNNLLKTATTGLTAVPLIVSQPPAKP